MKTKILTLLFVIVAATAVYLSYKSAKMSSKVIEISRAEISQIKSMARLCAVDIYSEVPILDTINGKVMFAIQKQRGSVEFDLDNLRIDATGDTVVITLPPEIVELYEATDKNSWEVIDTKGLGVRSLLPGGDKFTLAEENLLKAKIRNNSKKLLYQNGTIRRARAEAASNLSMLMQKIYRKPIRILDPTPAGALR